jgi:hypothetical protein
MQDFHALSKMENNRKFYKTMNNMHLIKIKRVTIVSILNFNKFDSKFID